MQKNKSFHFRRFGKRIHHSKSDNSSRHDGDEVEEGYYKGESESDNEMSQGFNNGLESDPSLVEYAIQYHQQHDDSAKPSRPQTEVEMVKERFSKLLLGEDMSGAGKGVSSALTLSNAITNLAASVFGEQSKLGPMSEENKARWKREIDWLLAVTDHIVEFVPTKQKGKDGTSMEVMSTRQRLDLFLHIPILRKLDTVLVETLDNFKDQTEFWYVKKGDSDGDKKSDKWWLPTVKVPPEGLSDAGRKWLYSQKESAGQVLKAATFINGAVLSEMEVPENYIESLPKNGRESLGDSLYKNITEDHFDPGNFLSTMDLSNEHKVLDLKNRIEASIVIWKRKMTNKDGKAAWVSHEKRELFEDRAESILSLMKDMFPGIPQSSLEISKIQYNKDVGQSILESYSRVIESLAHTISSRIEDVLYADSMAVNPSTAVHDIYSRRLLMVESAAQNHREEMEKFHSSPETLTSMTLSDFMSLSTSDGAYDMFNFGDLNEETQKENGQKSSYKAHKYYKHKHKKNYWDKIEHFHAIKGPLSRH